MKTFFLCYYPVVILFRRFIWAEMSYLSMWWRIADPDRKNKMKKLVHNGQLEMVTAGWVMNDEANTHYFAMIDQMIEGIGLH